MATASKTSHRQDLKVLILHNILWAPYKAVVFNELAALCHAQQLELRVLHLAPKGKSQANLGEPDLTRHNYPYRVLFNESYEEIGRWASIRAVSTEISAYRPDCLVVPGYGILSLAAILCARRSNIKVLMAVDSTEHDWKRVWIKELYKRFVVRLCDAFLCFGSLAGDYVVSLGGRKETVFSGCQAADNAFFQDYCANNVSGRDTLKAQLGLKPNNFLYVGRLVGIKNLEVLIASFVKVKSLSPRAGNWGLVIVGDGEMKRRLEELAFNLHARDITFTGGKSWHELPVYYNLAEVFVLPSLSEPWGMVLNEAMACGLPVIVSDRCGAVADLVERGSNGFTFNPGDGDALVEVMLRFVDETVDRRAMGKRSKEIIARFSPAAAAANMLAGLRSTL